MTALADTTALLSLFSDPTRVRLMALLSKHELTVAEVTSVTQLAQSRVSTHLGKLREAEVLRDRRVGASTFYALNDAAMPDDAAKLWALVSQGLDDAVLHEDLRRATSAVRARDGGASWPDAIAGEMERHYSPGRTWESLARGVLGLLRLGHVLDVGSGDGALAQLLLPHADSVTLVERSEKMLAAARARLEPHATNGHHARFVLGDAHELPQKDCTFDVVLLFNVLTAVHTPSRVIAEAARVTKKRGRVAIVTLAEHAHGEVTAAYHHLHAGFKPAALKKLLAKSGLDVVSCEVTSRERRDPHFQVISAIGEKP